jgi:histidyl-tRNA synthetase
VLDEEAKRLYSNPLRVLDTKNPAMQDMVNAAPKLMDYLGDASKAHLKAVQDILDANDVAWSLNPRLVRGMDYYNLTVFEFITDKLGSQGTICGGGRYDYLIEEIGGKPRRPWAGAWVWSACWKCSRRWGRDSPARSRCLRHHSRRLGAAPGLQDCAAAARAGVAVQMHAAAGGSAEGMGSMKSQFKKADGSGARFALIFGADELAQGKVTVKSLRDGEGQQVQQALADVALWAGSLKSAV